MDGRGPALDRGPVRSKDAQSPDGPAAPEPAARELEVAPANSVLAHALTGDRADLAVLADGWWEWLGEALLPDFLFDWFFPPATEAELPAAGAAEPEPAPAPSPVPAGEAAAGPPALAAGVPAEGTAPVPVAAEPEGAERPPAAAEPADREGPPGPVEGAPEAAGAEAAAAAPGPAPAEPPAAPAAPAPLGVGEDVQQRVDAAAGSLPHPAAPVAARSRLPLDRARAGIEARGEARSEAMLAAPRRIAGSAPAHRRPPRPDPGPIPEQMAVVRAKTGRLLDPAVLPPLTPSPRGTMPDLTKPVLSETQIRIVRLGEPALLRMTTGADEQGREELARLRGIRESLGQSTAAEPQPTTPGTIGPLAPVPGVPVVDEPVAGVALSPKQRAMFAGVVADLREDLQGQGKRVLSAVRRNHSRYPGGVLDRAFPTPVGEEDLAPAAVLAVSAETDNLAGALDLAPGQLDTAITLRRAEVQRLKSQSAQAGTTATTDAQATAAEAEAKARAAARASAAATARAVAADRAVARPPSRTQARVEQALAELREPIATELARLDEQLRLRERAIADAIRIQVSAIRLAQVRDEIALDVAPGTPGTPEGRLQAAAVGRWANKAVADLQEGEASAQARLVKAVADQTATFKSELQAAATDALVAVRAWGAEHARATDTWWIELDAQLGRWTTDAAARATLWEHQQQQAARLALAQDLEAIEHLAALSDAKDKAAVDAYLDRLDAESRTVVMALLGGGALDWVDALTAGVRERVRARNQAGWEVELDRMVLGLDLDKKENRAGYDLLLTAVQPGWKVDETAAKIHTAVTRWRGHDEEAIYEALSGLSPLAARLLPWFYLHRYDQTLEDALRGRGHVGYLTEEEMKTAHQLLEGDRVQGAIGAIDSAISGPGAAIDAVNRILRSLTEAERRQVIAGYERRFGESLEAALRSQWSLSRSEVDESMAIAHSDLMGASAIALQRSVRTVYTDEDRFAVMDRKQAEGVYAQIRSDVEAEGTRRGWVSAEIEAEITLRNQELGQRFDVQAGQEWWAQQRPGVSATQAAFALTSNAGKDLLQGLAENNRVKVDVARLRIEDAGVYADDAAILAVFRDQSARSLAEVNRDLGPVLRARQEERLRQEEKAGKFPTEEARVNRRMELEQQDAAELAGLANARTNTRMDHLGSLYQEKARRTLSAMVEDNMSGTQRREARAHVEQRGVLSNYQKLRFSMEGWGTDMPMLRSTLASMSKKELEKANEDWKVDHPGETLIQAIKDDTSGRDQQDLVDMATYGAPKTAAEVVAAAHRRFDLDRKGETKVGAWFTSREIDTAAEELQTLDTQLKELRKTGQSRDQRWRASMTFDIAVERANTAIDLQRQALDSVTDLLANAAAIVTAVVVGLALSPFTGGGSAVVAAAIISSISATAVSMAVKQLVKGAAYGREEIYTDLAVGAVDALVAALTAGLGNALLGKAAGSVSPVGKSAMFRALSRMGSVGRAAAQGQARVAGLLGRLGTQGALVRGLERQALLGGLYESKYLVNRLIAKGASQLIEQGIQAVPTSLAGTLLDESVYRQPGGPLAVLNNTVAGTVHNTLMGLGIAAAHHVGLAGAKFGVQGMKAAIEGVRVMMPREIRMPTGDVLGHVGTPTERLADFREWRRQNPQGTVGEFNAQRRAQVIEEWQLADPQRERIRDARQELLAGLPEAERGRYADVPIRSVSDAEFARLTGNHPADARLLVREGQAVILLREGAPAGAVAPLLLEVRERVFAGTYGMAVEAALPPRLRDTPIRIDPTLPHDEIRVVPIPPHGPITGVEVVVGPDAHPIDVALHAGEVARLRRWTGLVGDARMALARYGERVGLRLETPLDRTRLEAAGELRKLGPLIEERMRRAALAKDPHAAAALEAQALHLLAQHERAHRILTGELVVEPRGYIAAKATKAPPAKPAEKPLALSAHEAEAVTALNRLEELMKRLTIELPGAEAKAGVIETQVAKMWDHLSDTVKAVTSKTPELAWLGELNMDSPADRKRLRAGVKDFLQEHPEAGRPVPKVPPKDVKVGDLLWRLQALETAEAAVPRRQEEAAKRVESVRKQYAQAEAEVQHWIQRLMAAPSETLEAMTGERIRVGVRLSPLLPEPRARREYLPKLLAGESLVKKVQHLFGMHAELCMANRIAEHLHETVVEYGDVIGTHGADATSVDSAGWVTLWDSKYRSGGAEFIESETFTEGSSRLDDAVVQAVAAVEGHAEGIFSETARATAAANLKKGDFTAYTVTSDDATTFHTCVKMEFRNHKLVSTERVSVPWGAGK
jgi:hypothetical protein